MNTAFSNSDAIQSSLGSQLQRITNAGLAGQGFTPGQETNLRSDAIERGAQSNAQAEVALNRRNAMTGEGGSTTSGAVGQANEQLASSAAASTAGAQRGITDENAQLARQNVTQGLGGLSSLAGQETGEATSLAGTSVGAAGNSFNAETQAYQPSNFWSGLATSAVGMGLNAIAPGVGSLATGLLGGIGGKGTSPGGDNAQYGFS